METKERMEKERQDRAFNFLKEAGLFFGVDEYLDADLTLEERDKWERMLNLNDTFGWGCADCQLVEMVDMPELKRLFFNYGWCGILYWVSELRGGIRSEFRHYNRMIEFVKSEEGVRKSYSSEAQYAYGKVSYVVGQDGGLCK